MLPILFHPATSEEVRTSFDWYQEQFDGLGRDFIQELDEAVHSIQSLPDTWPKMGKFHRRFVLSRFPYSVIYKVLNDETIFVVAIMHNHRQPGYWYDRN
ncbi:plasmid stabilization protein [Arsukibacterium sp. MJ3]|uniref:type II toxin-antitoxin system RelE/ParE family toxin n=1 Tax=Arsukibacterium sp. MJ3 TaxID=1632859 RepID=UPI000626F01C|nr:plasmid stabilization protein [Arsukibacterium sp. MJ3]